MTFPTVVVDMQFDRGPYATDLGGVTFTALRARAFHSKVGRTDEIEATVPGSASFTLDNSDRRYDPTHVTGPYYGRLKPGRLIRVAATWAGTTYYPFVGVAESWPQTFSPPSSAEVELPCVDMLGLLSWTKMPSSVYESEVEADNPMAWYRLGETSGATMNDSSGNDRDGTFVGNPTNGGSEDGLLLYDTENQAISFDPRSQYGRAPYPELGPLDAGAVVNGKIYELWVRGRGMTEPLVNTVYPLLVASRTGAASQAAIIGLDANMRLRAGNRFSSMWRFDNGPAFGQHITHHIVFISGNLTTALYIDGVVVPLAGATPAGAWLPPAPQGVTISAAKVASTAPGQPELVIDEVAVYDPADIATTVAALVDRHYAAGVSPWNADTTHGRIDNLLSLAEFGFTPPTYPATQRQLTLGPAVLDASLVEMMRRIETTEQGRLRTSYSVAAGINIELMPHDPFESSSEFTFTDENIVGALHYDSITYDSGETNIYNAIKVEYGADADNSRTTTVTDAASIALYGRRELTVPTYIGGPKDARAVGEYVLFRHKEPHVRITEMVLLPSADNRLWPAALGLKIGSRVIVKFQPQNLGARVTVNATIEGVEHDVDGGINQWRTTYFLSSRDVLPGTPGAAGVYPALTIYPALTLYPSATTGGASTGTIPTYWVWGTSSWGGGDMRWYL